MTTKTVVKKAPTRRKKIVDHVSVPAVPHDDGIYWTVSERKLFTWRPIEVYKNRSQADAVAEHYEDVGYNGFNSYRVDRVLLK